MLIKKLRLQNFRNYHSSEVDLPGHKILIIGENAQGKSNLLEAIEIASTGKSTRTNKDADLISWGSNIMHMEVVFERSKVEETISIELRPSAAEQSLKGPNKQIMVNGVTHSSVKALLGRLVIVSFKSHDLNLLRGGPKYRREWVDSVILRIKPRYHDLLASYNKTVAQRNRLLKQLFEHGKVTVTDQDQLLAWDKQLARFGSHIIKQRLQILSELLPLASIHQNNISGCREILDVRYVFRAAEASPAGFDDDQYEPLSDSNKDSHSEWINHLHQLPAEEIATILMRLLKERRSEEIARRQTLCGPHRDDIIFSLNNADAIAFASQGQQRTLVLSIKLAELERITDSLEESPVLLLDDVLAELDILRQGCLMSKIPSHMQTIITTTHLSGFEPIWLQDSNILSVHAGTISPHIATKA